LLTTGVLLACAPDQPANTKTTQTQNTTQGLKVYVDPATGEFLGVPPPESSSLDNQKTKKNTDNSNLSTTQTNKITSEQKESSTPGGGTYIEMPAP